MPKNGQKTLEETLEKHSSNARETLEVSASSLSRCNQPRMIVMWSAREGLGRGARPSLDVPARCAKKVKRNALV